MGVVYPVRPQEEQPQWRGQPWSPGALDSAPAVTPELSVCRAWRLRGRAADLLSSGQERPRCPGPSRPLPVPGGGRILGCVPAPSAPGPALLDSRSRPAAPSAEPPPSPPPSCSGSAVRAAALRELGALSWASRCLLLSQGARGHPRPPGVLLQLPASPFPPGKVGAAPAPLGRGSPVLGTLAPASARLLAGPLPLGGLLFLYFFFPVFLP